MAAKYSLPKWFLSQSKDQLSFGNLVPKELKLVQNCQIVVQPSKTTLIVATINNCFVLDPEWACFTHVELCRLYIPLFLV